MKTRIVQNIIVGIITFFIIMFVSELCLSAVFYIRDKKVSFFLKKLNSRSETKIDTKKTTPLYEIPWDFEKDKMRPGKYYTKEGVAYTVNSLGFRGKEFDPVNKSKYRIICFGGSSTLGLESPEDSTYPAILERLLINSGINAEVLNFGFGSKSLNFIEKLLFREAIIYKPDLITIYSNRNTALYDSSSSYYETTDIKKCMFNYQLYNLHHALFENLMTYRAIFSIYSKFILPLHSSNIQIGKQSINEYYFKQEYFKKLERIILAGELYGFKVCLIKQPLYLNPPLQMKIKDYPIDKLVEIMKEENNDMYISATYPDDNNATKFWILTNAILNKQLDNLKNKYKDVLIVDPLDSFLGKDLNYEELFHDYVHLTPLGNKLLAKNIFTSIRQIILKVIQK